MKFSEFTANGINTKCVTLDSDLDYCQTPWSRKPRKPSIFPRLWTDSGLCHHLQISM